jgi:hypothetical protein
MGKRVGVLVAVCLIGCGAPPGDAPEQPDGHVADDAATDDAATDDAATDDAATDAAIDGAAAANVTLTVRSYLGQLSDIIAGAPVMFMDASGAIASQTTSDAMGRASGVVPPGGSVTVDNGQLTTFYDVEDGEDLAVGGPQGGNEAPAGTVVVPDGPPDTTLYRVVAGCVRGESHSTTVDLWIWPGCSPGPRVALASASMPGIPKFRVLTALSLPLMSTLTLTGPWAEPAIFTTTLHNVPPSWSILAHNSAVAGDQNLHHTPLAMPPAVAGVTSATSIHPPEIGDGTMVSLILGAEGLRHLLAWREPGYRTGFALGDLAAEMLPAVADLSGSSTGASWTIGPGRAYDGIIVRFEGQTANGGSRRWYVIAPVGTTSLTLPAVPGWGPFVRTHIMVSLVEGSHVEPGRDFRKRYYASSNEWLGIHAVAKEARESARYGFF